MAERKFADEEVIKALEWCIQNSECEYCEYREKTDKSDICPIRMDALNLINKQNAEVERLQAEKDALIKNYAECMKNYASEIFAEIDKILKMQEKYLYCNPSLTFVYELIEELKKKYTGCEQ